MDVTKERRYEEHNIAMDVSASHAETGVENVPDDEEGKQNALSTPNSCHYRSMTQQQQATEIVKALFGNAGKVVGTFSCSVTRQSGRLYVSTEGLLFYSVSV